MKYKYLDIQPRGRDLCFFDLETTGLSTYAEIIEIGAVRVETDAFNVMDEFEIKIMPQHLELADPEALAVNSYDKEIWEKEAVDVKTGLTKFVEFAEGSILSAHNLAMDWMWLQRSLEDNGMEPSYVYSGIDTITLAWQKFNKLGIKRGLSLKGLAQYYNIDLGTHHSALSDAKTAYRIFLKLLEDEQVSN